MKLSRDTWLLILLLAILLAILTIAGLSRQNRVLPLVSSSSAPNGAKALKLWLMDLGFTINEDLVHEFSPPPGVDTIFMLQPVNMFEPEWGPLDAWVRAGGTLVIAADDRWMASVAGHFDFAAHLALDSVPPLYPFSPLSSVPPVTDPVNVGTLTLLSSERDDHLILLAAKEGILATTFSSGRGRVVLCSAPYIFTNRGLKDDANAAFVLNLVSLAEAGSTVWFDEWHHGYRAVPPGEEIVGPGQWLRKTAIGNSLLFIFGVIVLGLFLQGRAFGRPVPLPREVRRRTVMEHVTAVANLNRRAGHRVDVMQQYHQQVKRHLGRRYRLDPALPDAEYVAALRKFNPNLDHEKLLNLLQGLGQKDASEGDMVKLAAEASEWIKE